MSDRSDTVREPPSQEPDGASSREKETPPTMRFPTVFRRRVGMPPVEAVPQSWLDSPKSPPKGVFIDWNDVLIPELGSDKLPPKGEQPSRRDNLHESTLVNKNGFPSQRVVVGYHGPDGAPPLIADLFLLDETSGIWFKVPSLSDGVLTPGTLSYFDPPCLLDHSRAKRNQEDESHMSGSLEVLLIPWRRSPEGELVELPPGVYTFVVGTDVSNPG